MEEIADDLADLRPRRIDIPDLVAGSAAFPGTTTDGQTDPLAGLFGGGVDPTVAELVNALKAEINRLSEVQFRLQKTDNEYPDW